MIEHHPLAAQDVAAVAGLRQATAAHKGDILGIEARSMFDATRAATPPADGVLVTPGRVGGVSGFWRRPSGAASGACVLFLHGGRYVLGSAQPLTNFAGQIALHAGADTFVADYRLAPEHPFPAAIDDAAACYRGLVDDSYGMIAVIGDSAGGSMTLALLSMLAAAMP